MNSGERGSLDPKLGSSCVSQGAAAAAKKWLQPVRSHLRRGRASRDHSGCSREEGPSLPLEEARERLSGPVCRPAGVPQSLLSSLTRGGAPNPRGRCRTEAEGARGPWGLLLAPPSSRRTDVRPAHLCLETREEGGPVPAPSGAQSPRMRTCQEMLQLPP